MRKSLKKATTGRDSPNAGSTEVEVIEKPHEDHYERTVFDKILGPKNLITTKKATQIKDEGIHFAERMATTFAASTAEGYKPEALQWGPADARLVTGATLKVAGLGQLFMNIPGHKHTLAVGDGVMSSFVASKGVQLGQYLRSSSTTEENKPQKPKALEDKQITEGDIGAQIRDIYLTPEPDYSDVPDPTRFPRSTRK